MATIKLSNDVKLETNMQFIDTSNVIASVSAYDISYMATEDCYCRVRLGGTYMTNAIATIDGVTVATFLVTVSSSDQPQGTFGCYLKKGQVLRAYVGDSRRGTQYIWAYALK